MFSFLARKFFSSGFSFPPIIHENIMNVTLSMCKKGTSKQEKNDDNKERKQEKESIRMESRHIHR